MMHRITAVALALVLSCFAQPQATLSQEPTPAARPIGDKIRGEIAELVADAITQKKMPGCVICFGNGQRIEYLEAFGRRKTIGETEAMTTNTVFDLASLTKPIATATSVMQLLEQGKLRLHSRAAEIVPEFGINGKDAITIQQLLVHQSGLIPDNPLRDYLDGPELAWQRICELEPVAPVGEQFKYSDVNFIVLAKIVEKLSGMDIATYSSESIFKPLKMTETGFTPADELKVRAAVTQRRDDQWMRGDVHDPRAWELGGVAGHAGLFSTASDLAIYGQMMLGRGSKVVEGKAVRVLSPTTFELMTSGYKVSRGTRGLGWDKQSPYSSNKGKLLSDAAFGHGGFTGTVLWVDPELDLFFVFLSNRVHPDGKGSVNRLAGSILDVIAGRCKEVIASRRKETE